MTGPAEARHSTTPSAATAAFAAPHRSRRRWTPAKIIGAVLAAVVLVPTLRVLLVLTGWWVTGGTHTKTLDPSGEQAAELLARTQDEVRAIVGRAGLSVVAFDPSPQAKVTEKDSDVVFTIGPAVVQTGVTTSAADGTHLVHHAVEAKLEWSNEWAIASCRLDPPP